MISTTYQSQKLHTLIPTKTQFMDHIYIFSRKSHILIIRVLFIGHKLFNDLVKITLLTRTSFYPNPTQSTTPNHCFTITTTINYISNPQSPSPISPPTHDHYNHLKFTITCTANPPPPVPQIYNNHHHLPSRSTTRWTTTNYGAITGNFQIHCYLLSEDMKFQCIKWARWR